MRTQTIPIQGRQPLWSNCPDTNKQSGQLPTCRRLITFVQELPETLQKFGTLLKKRYDAATYPAYSNNGGVANITTVRSSPSGSAVALGRSSGRLLASGRLIAFVQSLPALLWSSSAVVTNRLHGLTTNRILTGCVLGSAMATAVGGATGVGAGMALGAAYALRVITAPQALLICTSAAVPAAIGVATNAVPFGSIGSSVLVGGACTVGGLIVIRQGVQKVAKMIRPHSKRIIRVAASCLLGAAVGITIGGPIGLGIGLGLGLLGTLPEVRWVAQKAARAALTHLKSKRGSTAPKNAAVA